MKNEFTDEICLMKVGSAQRLGSAKDHLGMTYLAFLRLKVNLFSLKLGWKIILISEFKLVIGLTKFPGFSLYYQSRKEG